jgi:hypothetical protein
LEKKASKSVSSRGLPGRGTGNAPSEWANRLPGGYNLKFPKRAKPAFLLAISHYFLDTIAMT